MDPRALVSEIVSRVEDLPTGECSREQVREFIREFLLSDYPQLNPDQKKSIVAGVLQVLDDGDFFGIEFVSDPFASGDDDEVEE